MRGFDLLPLIGVCLSGFAAAAIDDVFDAAFHRSTLPANFMVNKFVAMGMQPNRTIINDDGTEIDLYQFDHDPHDGMMAQMVREVLAAGPNNSTEPTSSVSRDLIARQAGDQDTFSCKASQYYLYSYALNSAASGVCGAIFTYGPDAGVNYAVTRYLSDYRGQQVKTIWSYTWFVPGFAAANACATLMTKIVTEGCYTQLNGNEGTAQCSNGGTLDEIQGDYAEAHADISIDRD